MYAIHALETAPFSRGLTALSPTRPTLATAPSTSAPSSETLNPGSRGLSSSAKVGIGVGVSVSGLLLIVALVVIFVLIRRNRAKKLALAKMDIQDKPELFGKAITKYQVPSELSGIKPVHEMDDTSKPVEIGG